MQNMNIAYKRGLEGKPAPKWCANDSLVYKSYLKGKRKRMDKRRRIEQDIETITIHQVECGSCGNVFQSEDDTVDDFISEIENDIHYAISKEYGLQGLVCDDCFNDEDADWQEYEKATN